MEVSQWCSICKQPVNTGGPSVSSLREKGSSAINQASSISKDSIHTVPGEKVHKDCRQDAKQEESEPGICGHRHVLRSSDEEFTISRLIASFVVDQPSLEGRGRDRMFF